ncbi:hypothetical protein EJ06DRAFT_85953 [Trichodelitschia bisporula]|uniref:Uncharacterized protein n=1 Tax=Trichodelitschia bisporula TaxID=703511 RepID=A0A6G1HRT8_9PEZI|nr:hypothetical protein EJ06DRAFT_85953 [Trichodelitschia bisporula]
MCGCAPRGWVAGCGGETRAMWRRVQQLEGEQRSRGLSDGEITLVQRSTSHDRQKRKNRSPSERKKGARANKHAQHVILNPVFIPRPKPPPTFPVLAPAPPG